MSANTESNSTLLETNIGSIEAGSTVSKEKVDELREVEIACVDEQEYVPVGEDFARIVTQDKPSLDSFARGEVLSHELPYLLADTFKPGDRKIVAAVDDDGKERSYEVRMLHTTHDGLKAFALVGVDADNSRVKVLFRGTACGASAIRDLEEHGAGQESFNKDKDLLLGQVFNIIKERATVAGKKVKLDVAGHSLGGADAQNFTAALAESCAKRAEEKRLEESSSLRSKIKSAAKKVFGSCLRRIKKKPLKNADAVDHIESVEMHVANSAGVSKKTARIFKKATEVLNDPLHRRDDKADFSLNFLMVAGDGVQQTGQTSIGADVDPSHAQVKVLKVDTGQGQKCANYWNPIGAIQGIIGTTAAHTSKHFIGKDNLPAEMVYMLLDNRASAEERNAIKAKLTKKSWFENSRVAYWIKKAMINVAKCFKSCKRSVPSEVEELAEARDTDDIELMKTVVLERQEVAHATESRKSLTTDDLTNSVIYPSETRSSLLRQFEIHASRRGACVSLTDDVLLERRREEKASQYAASDCRLEALSTICKPLPLQRRVC